MISFDMPLYDYRKFTGEFASASAVACVIAINCVNSGKIASTAGNNEVNLNNKGILILGLGDFITAIEITK